MKKNLFIASCISFLCLMLVSCSSDDEPMLCEDSNEPIDDVKIIPEAPEYEEGDTVPLGFDIGFNMTASKPSDESEDEDTTRGCRAPSKPISCHISESTGVVIPGVDKSDIISFEVYNENGICLASLTEESEFISFLFSLSEPVEIRIITDQYIYHGYISLSL